MPVLGAATAQEDLLLRAGWEAGTPVADCDHDVLRALVDPYRGPPARRPHLGDRLDRIFEQVGDDRDGLGGSQERRKSSEIRALVDPNFDATLSGYAHLAD